MKKIEPLQNKYTFIKGGVFFTKKSLPVVNRMYHFKKKVAVEFVVV